MPLAVFHRALSGRLVIAGLDLVTYFYPYRVMAARVLGGGRLPLWNPDLYAGVPFLANIQAAVFYPPNLLFILIPGPQAVTWSIIGHLVLAGLLFFAFGRRALGLPAVASVVGALAFSAGGFALTQTDHLNQNNVFAWMPGVVLAVDQAYRRRSWRWSVGLGVVVALQLFAGHPQEQYYTAAVAAAWLVMLIVRDRRSGLGEIWGGLSRPLLGGTLGIGVASIQLIPTLEMSRYGIRAGGVPFADANFLALPFHQLLASIVPDYSTQVPLEWAGTIGLLPLLLAVVAVVRQWRDPVVLLLAGLALAALAIALGRTTPFFWLAYHVLPGFASFRVPPRVLLVFTFAAAALAAIGVGELLAQRDRNDRPWVVLAAAGGLFLLAFPLAWLLQRDRLLPVLDALLPAGRWVLLARWLALIAALVAIAFAARRWPLLSAALVVLIAGELYAAARPLDAVHPLPASVFSRNPLIDQALPSDRSPFRSVSVAQAAGKHPPISTADQGALAAGDFRYANFRSARVGDWPNFPMQSARATLDGYDGGLLPLTSYVRFRGLLVAGGSDKADYPIPYLTDHAPDLRLLGLLGVRYILEDAGASSGTPDRLATEGVSIIENPDALTHAFVVHTLSASAGVENDLNALANPFFDVGTQAIVAGGTCPTGTSGAADRVELLRNDAETVSVRVTTDSPGLLVIGTTDYPGWQARVDGKSQPVLLVDTLVQGVCLPAGRHVIELSFTPSHWALAMALSGLSLLGLVLLGIGPLLLKRRASGGTARGEIGRPSEPVDAGRIFFPAGRRKEQQRVGRREQPVA